MRRTIAVDAIVPPDTLRNQLVEAVNDIFTDVGIVVFLNHQGRGRAVGVERAQSLANARASNEVLRLPGDVHELSLAPGRKLYRASHGSHEGSLATEEVVGHRNEVTWERAGVG